jgi:hypothetical protein
MGLPILRMASFCLPSTESVHFQFMNGFCYHLQRARNEPIIITRNFRTLLRNIPMKNPATPLPANETRVVGMVSIIFFLTYSDAM